MIKILILLFTITGSVCTAFGQKEKEFRDLNIIPRAKVLTFVAIEDLWATSFSGGVEFRFFDQFSIIADVVHYNRREEEEIYISSTKYEEYALTDARNYMAYELRYYPKILSRDHLFRPYISTMGKVGNRFLHVQDKYPIDEGQAFRINGTIRDFGGLLGFTLGERFGFDMSLGAAYRWEVRSEDILVEDEKVEFKKGVIDNRWQACIRASFYFNFGQ